jgi:hypothetical protein
VVKSPHILPQSPFTHSFFVGRRIRMQNEKQKKQKKQKEEECVSSSTL